MRGCTAGLTLQTPLDTGPPGKSCRSLGSARHIHRRENRGDSYGGCHAPKQTTGVSGPSTNPVFCHLPPCGSQRSGKRAAHRRAAVECDVSHAKQVTNAMRPGISHCARDAPSRLPLGHPGAHLVAVAHRPCRASDAQALSAVHAGTREGVRGLRKRGRCQHRDDDRRTQHAADCRTPRHGRKQVERRVPCQSGAPGEYFACARTTVNTDAAPTSATESLCQPLTSDSIMACVPNPVKSWTAADLFEYPRT